MDPLKEGMVMKAEILAPVGNPEMFDAALAAGADAVYMSFPKFGARAFARNFSEDEMKDMISRAHLAGMKVYITMNTLLEDSQMEEAAALAGRAWQMGADALIIQDLGLLHLLHETMPEIELHASTQLSVNRPEQIERLKKLGVKRVVLAREASLEEIRNCSRAGLELEVFVHGAICISYSGQCQFSRIRYGRSGNKGACAQPCRMEYTLYKDGKEVPVPGSYLLSPKDLSTLNEIGKLEKAGVDSLKIEGRMKSPVYVFESVLKARKAQNGIRLDQRDIRDLTVAFSRGFTKGHTASQTGLQLMNLKSGAHQGEKIGRVVSVGHGRARIRLDEPLNQHDGIRFENEKSSSGCRVNFLYDSRGRLVSGLRAGETAEVPVEKGVYPGAVVRKTVDAKLENEVEHAIQQTRRQRDVDFYLIAQGESKPVLLRAVCNTYEVQKEKMIAQKPQKRATTEEDFIKQLSKTGNTWAHAANIDVDIRDEVFVPLKEINRLRDEVLQELAEQILKERDVQKKPYSFAPAPSGPLPDLVEVQKKEQMVQPGTDSLTVISQFPLPGTAKKAALYENEGLVSAHLGDAEIVSDMNITNSYALAALLQMGYKGGVLSAELSDEGRRDLFAGFRERYGFDAPAIVPVYGASRLMLMQHCPVNTAEKDGTRKNCSLCRTSRYVLEGKDGKKAILYGDPSCRMQIFDEEKMDRIDDIPEMEKEGARSFLVSLSTEDHAESQAVVNRFEEVLKKS